jgi:hypothetical protein
MQAGYYRLMNGLVRLPDNRPARDKNYVMPGHQVGMRTAHRFSQQSSDPIPNHCPSQALTGYKPIAVMDQAVRGKAQNQKRVPPHVSRLLQLSKIFFTAESQMTLHRGQIGLTLPVDLLDVMTHLGRQNFALTSTASLEHPASVFGLHPLAETMHANTTAFFRLVGTLRHNRNLFQKNAHRGAVKGK